MACSGTPVQQLVRHVQVSGHSKLEIIEKALAEIQEVNNRLIVIAIVGHVKSGKSYLLNRLFSPKNQGFPVGHKINPTTQGIWMYLMDDPTTENITFLILDTEGFGKSDMVDTYMEDMIQGIAYSVSSTVIMNGQRIIEEGDIEKLAHFIEIAGHLHPIEATDESAKPNLVYLLQGFALKRNITDDDEYLQNVLKIENKEEYHNSKRLIPRRKIQEAFSRTKCFLLPPPVRDHRYLKKLTEVEEDDISSSYKTKVDEELHMELRNSSSPKSVDGHPVTGEEWSSLLIDCVEKANRKNIAEIASLPELLREKSHDEARRHSDQTRRNRHRDTREKKLTFQSAVFPGFDTDDHREAQDVVSRIENDMRRWGPDSFKKKVYRHNRLVAAVVGKSGGRFTLPDESVTLDIAPNALDSYMVLYFYRPVPSPLGQEGVVYYSTPLCCGPVDIPLGRPAKLKFRHFADIEDRRQKNLLVVFTRKHQSETFEEDVTAQIEVHDKLVIVSMFKLCDVVVGAKLPSLET